MQQIAERVGRLLEKRGLVERDLENAWLASAVPEAEQQGDHRGAAQAGGSDSSIRHPRRRGEEAHKPENIVRNDRQFFPGH